MAPERHYLTKAHRYDRTAEASGHHRDLVAVPGSYADLFAAWG